MEKLLNSYRNRIFGFLLKYVKIPEVAEDLTQEVLIKLWKNKERFQEIEDKEAYMLAVTRNLIRDHFKKITQEEKYKAEVWNHIPTVDNTMIRSIQRSELTSNIKSIVHTLPERQQEIYFLIFKKGLSLAEIAQELKISPYTAKNHLSKALKVIRSKINPESFLTFIWIVLTTLSSYLAHSFMG